jgi:hypothetical protein
MVASMVFFLGRMGCVKVIPSPFISLSPAWSTSQGCCKEYFSRMLQRASMSPGFRFHPKCGIHDINHLAFADDVILLSQGDRQSVSCLFQQLLIFGKISGLSINMDKSSIYFGGVSERLKQIILEDTRLVS